MSLSHVTWDWAMSHIHESCHISKSHVSYQKSPKVRDIWDMTRETWLIHSWFTHSWLSVLNQKSPSVQSAFPPLNPTTPKLNPQTLKLNPKPPKAALTWPASNICAESKSLAWVGAAAQTKNSKISSLLNFRCLWRISRKAGTQFPLNSHSNAGFVECLPDLARVKQFSRREKLEMQFSICDFFEAWQAITSPANLQIASPAMFSELDMLFSKLLAMQVWICFCFFFFKQKLKIELWYLQHCSLSLKSNFLGTTTAELAL